MMNPNNLKRNHAYWSDTKHRYLIFSHTSKKKDGTLTYHFTDFGDLLHRLTNEEVARLTPRRR